MTTFAEEVKETIVSKILSEIKSYEGRDITDLEFAELVNKTYNSIDERITTLLDPSKSGLFVVDDYADISDLAISLADLHIISFLKRYSLNSLSAPYQIPHNQLSRVIRIYGKKLMLKDADNSTINELTSMMFSTMYLNSFYKAQECRKSLSK